MSKANHYLLYWKVSQSDHSYNTVLLAPYKSHLSLSPLTFTYINLFATGFCFWDRETRLVPNYSSWSFCLSFLKCWDYTLYTCALTFVCMYVYEYTCMYMYHTCAWCSQRWEEGTKFPGTGAQIVVRCYVSAGKWYKSTRAASALNQSSFQPLITSCLGFLWELGQNSLLCSPGTQNSLCSWMTLNFCSSCFHLKRDYSVHHHAQFF